MLLNKTDLLPYVDFDVERCIGYARQVNPDIEALCVSARSGEGMPAWLGWLRARSGQGRGPEVLLRKEAGGTVRA
jgi:hydrogenase nickel incorporation protein HypB